MLYVSYRIFFQPDYDSEFYGELFVNVFRVLFLSNGIVGSILPFTFQFGPGSETLK